MVFPGSLFHCLGKYQKLAFLSAGASVSFLVWGKFERQIQVLRYYYSSKQRVVSPFVSFCWSSLLVCQPRRQIFARQIESSVIVAGALWETMSDVILLFLVVVLLACLIATVGFFLLYSGLLTDVHIKTGPPPIRNVTIAYKFKEGPYKECGAAFTESSSIGPKLSSIGVFYDDPKQVRPYSTKQLLWI